MRGTLLYGPRDVRIQERPNPTIIEPTQNQWDYLAVLVDAIRRYGAPEAIVRDGGGQFYSTVALQLYEMLGIRKERIVCEKCSPASGALSRNPSIALQFPDHQE